MTSHPAVRPEAARPARSATHDSLIDSAAFAELRTEMDSLDERREHIIKASRSILKDSKRAIYRLHRGDDAGAQECLTAARRRKQELEQLMAGELSLRAGSFSSACEEYTEAAAFAAFLRAERLPTRDELGVTAEEYLLGLADFTGELARRAVLAATRRDEAEVQRIHTLLEELYGLFVEFDFRNGELRRKYDSIKYNLRKVEEVRYELSRTNT